MTVSIGFSTVTGSIAALSISGVTIKDIDEIPEDVAMLTPILFPQPAGFITDIAPEFVSFGSNGAAKMDLTYTLNYVYLHAPVGSGINALAPYAGMIMKLANIFVEIMSNDAITGAVDVRLGSLPNLGVVTAPNDEDYWGALITLRILEHIQ